MYPLLPASPPGWMYICPGQWMATEAWLSPRVHSSHLDPSCICMYLPECSDTIRHCGSHEIYMTKYHWWLKTLLCSAIPSVSPQSPAFPITVPSLGFHFTWTSSQRTSTMIALSYHLLTNRHLAFPHVFNDPGAPFFLCWVLLYSTSIPPSSTSPLKTLFACKV